MLFSLNNPGRSPPSTTYTAISRSLFKLIPADPLFKPSYVLSHDIGMVGMVGMVHIGMVGMVRIGMDGMVPSPHQTMSRYKKDLALNNTSLSRTTTEQSPSSFISCPTSRRLRKTLTLKEAQTPVNARVPCNLAHARRCECKLFLLLITLTVFLIRCGTDPLVHHGRHFGRTIHALCNVRALISGGLLRMVELANRDEDTFPLE
jgi:hypothetical protein